MKVVLKYEEFETKLNKLEKWTWNLFSSLSTTTFMKIINYKVGHKSQANKLQPTKKLIGICY